VQARDRLVNLVLLAAAVAAWAVVWIIVTTRDPVADAPAGYLGAAAMGTAVAVTTTPLFWLAAFARHRRIAYRGDWFRAARRGLWCGLIVGLFVVMRLLGVFDLPVALFVLALVLIAEVTLSIEH
jgi:hypothetical protein